MPECGPTIAHERCQRFGSLNVVRVYIEARFRDYSNMVKIAGEVSGERLNKDMGGPVIRRKND